MKRSMKYFTKTLWCTRPVEWRVIRGLDAFIEYGPVRNTQPRVHRVFATIALTRILRFRTPFISGHAS